MTEPRIFSPRHGLRYRWWRDIPWDIIVMTLMLVAMLIFLLAAWFLDWKA